MASVGAGGGGGRSAHAWKCAVPSFVRAQLKHDRRTKSGRGHVAELQNSKFFRQGREEAPSGPETRQTLDLDCKRTKNPRLFLQRGERGGSARFQPH